MFSFSARVAHVTQTHDDLSKELFQNPLGLESFALQSGCPLVFLKLHLEHCLLMPCAGKQQRLGLLSVSRHAGLHHPDDAKVTSSS